MEENMIFTLNYEYNNQLVARTAHIRAEITVYLFAKLYVYIASIQPKCEGTNKETKEK